MQMQGCRWRAVISGLCVGFMLGVFAAVVAPAVYGHLAARASALAAWQILNMGERSDYREAQRLAERDLLRLAEESDFVRAFLLARLRHGTEMEACHAARLLGEVGSDLGALERLTQERGRNVRLSLISSLALVAHVNASALPVLEEAIEDQDAGIRLAAVLALLKVGVPICDAEGFELSIPSGFTRNPHWAEWEDSVLRNLRYDPVRRRIVSLGDVEPDTDN